MRRKSVRSAMFLVPVAGLFVLCSCANDQKKASQEVSQAVAQQQKEQKQQQEQNAQPVQTAQPAEVPAAQQLAGTLRPPGGSASETITGVFTVYSVDKSTRIVELKGVSGDLNSVKCGPDVVNFDQIQVGDEVKIMVTRSVKIFLRPGTEASAEGVVSVDRAPKGSKAPSATVAQTMEVTAKVNAIDTTNRIATLTGPKGNTFTVPVPDDVDLSKVTINDVVVVRYTQAMKIALVKPTN